MEELRWIGEHLFELVQMFFGGGVVFFAYSIRRDTRARRISNLIAINEQHRETWKTFYEHPELRRVLSKDAEVREGRVSTGEELFVTTLILHLNTAYQATKHGEFTSMEGLTKDVAEFFSLPIPKSVWEKNKEFQNRDFVHFIDTALK